ncbi:aminodeoxychorismate synthase component I [Sphingomonas sp.]|jgi:para-aminobenzoate synthetase/4-amino-4-deoxychorismate lyase|uniref:aminodeoxychorismate synthase component I n=1 Tax=Sphingomonas sp. TaxID=28214 RepID=UPI002EDA8A03
MVLTPPFVLLDDARPGGAGARLYHGSCSPIRAKGPQSVAKALATLRIHHDHNMHLAGFMTYEAAAGLADRAATHAAPEPCLWFGAFGHCDAQVDVEALLPDPASAWAGVPRPRVSRGEYESHFARVAEYIQAGDIYQANLTFRADVPFAGHPAALYALLRRRAGAGHGALVATGEQWILSFSPELFFMTDDNGDLVARPMKGTARRGATPAEDEALAASLSSDPKQRAENLMIVDLMRNDLSRIADPGSVRVPELFRVEQYPTVHQMVSTVIATPRDDIGAVEALAALFPCGSVTGAPKLRAMEVIAEVEGGPRGIYTGAIGRIDPDGGMAFNVAIRTLTIEPGASSATLGLGSGVVADSTAEEEWEECLAKGAFVTSGETAFDLIETMRFDPELGLPLLERHLARMKASAQAFGREFDRHAARNELQAATFRLRTPARVRLLLAPSGALAIGISPLPDTPDGPVTVAVRPHQVAPDDFRLLHKTSRRNIYARAPDAFETLYTDREGYLTEGSFTSLFVEREGVLVTPPLARGLLPGVLRAQLLASGRAVEGDLTPGDLENGFFIGNAVRGLVSAVTVADRVPAG